MQVLEVSCLGLGAVARISASAGRNLSGAGVAVRSDGGAGQVMSGAGVVRSDAGAGASAGWGICGAGVAARSDAGARRVMSGAGVVMWSSASAGRVFAGLVWGWRGVMLVLVLGVSCLGLARSSACAGWRVMSGAEAVARNSWFWSCLVLGTEASSDCTVLGRYIEALSAGILSVGFHSYIVTTPAREVILLHFHRHLPHCNLLFDNGKSRFFLSKTVR